MRPSLEIFKSYQFQPVIQLPPGYEIFDFTRGYDPDRVLKSPYGIGRYNEFRPGMYLTDLFSSSSGPSTDSERNWHIGVDIGAPVGTPVTAFFDGHLFCQTINGAAGDYGGTIITVHEIGSHSLWALHGHLGHDSLGLHAIGDRIAAGETLGHVGDRHENGGWNPHLHFQLSWDEPKVCDMPGVVNKKDLEEALLRHPDPRLVLGPLYADD